MRRKNPLKERKAYPRIDNPPEHPRNPPLEVKLNAIHRCYELGENIKYVSEDIGYSRASIYQWRKRYLKEGRVGLMNNKNIKPGQLKEGNTSNNSYSSDEIEQLKSQMQDMQLEINILKETIDVLKKDPGINHESLSNREKVVIIDALLKKDGLVIFEKIVRRIMKEEGLVVKIKKTAKYNSYGGEITPAVENVINRDFSATKPYE